MIRRLALVCVLVLGACSLGDRQNQADAVVDAVEASAATADLAGTMTATLRPRGDFSDFENFELPEGFDPSQFTPAPASAIFQILGTGEAALLASAVADDGSFPTVLFDDIGIRMRRPDALPEDARPWLDVAFDDLKEGRGAFETVTRDSAFAVVATLDPRIVLDLAAGPLAGSMKDLGSETLEGEATTHYRANFDIPRFLDETREDNYDEVRRDHVALLFDLLQIDRDVHPGDVWLAEDGTIARFEIRLRIDVDRNESYDLDLVFDPLGPAPIDARFTEPTPDMVVQVDSIPPLWRAAEAAAPDDALGGLLGG